MNEQKKPQLNARRLENEEAKSWKTTHWLFDFSLSNDAWIDFGIKYAP